ncbi:KxYKxGKxW signal peptide domain-containing protein, partial [Staphylococcus epidermidis]|uniref:KxYKxGKxW signal peptide domain-containing protein n=1 Tax=Staphylococcus epidermidis TaxID=1282 RepID=UPI0021A7E9AE
MTKKIKQFKDSFNEEKARVRLYKSGKNWIKAGIKEIQLLRVMGLPFNGQKITDKEDVNANNNSNNMKKNISKASAVIGGAFTFNMLNDHQAFAASETPVTSEISSNSTTVGDQTSTKESRDSAASTESKDSAASTESKDSAASTESKDSAASTESKDSAASTESKRSATSEDLGSAIVTNNSDSSSNSTSATKLRTFSRLATTTFAAAATSTTNTYTGAGTDTNYNIPIYYKLTTVNNGTSMTFTYTVTYDNPATTTVEKPTSLKDGYAIYNTGTSYQTMFTLGNGYGTPSSATSYITDSTGAKVSNPVAGTTPMVQQGRGYTWAAGYQMNGFQAKKGYGLTTTWTVPINSGGDKSFTFDPYSTSVTGGTNFFNGQKVTVTDPTSASNSQ